MDRHSHKSGWKTALKTHKPHTFFSDVGMSTGTLPNERSFSRLMPPEAFEEEAKTDTTEPAGIRTSNTHYTSPYSPGSLV